MKKIKDFIQKYKLPVIGFIALAIIVASVLVFGWEGLWYDAILAGIIGIVLTDMKKHSLLKVLTIILLVLVIVSNLLPGRQNTIERIGAADLLINYFSIVLQNFSYIVLFILSVGGFYGVLNKIPSYKKLLDNIVTKIKPARKKFIYATIILFAVITSLTGMTMPMFIFIPFIVSIILLLGYDKLVAFSSTFISIIVGYIGGLFVNFINPNSYSLTTYEEFVGISEKFTEVSLLSKLLLLLTGIALLIYFVSKHIKNVEEKKVKYELTDSNEVLIAEVKGNYKNIATWPLIVVFAILLVIMIIGNIQWSALFNITFFSELHRQIIEWKINDYAVIPNIISANLPALGEWSASGNFMAVYIYSSMLVVFATLIITLVYKIKINESIDNFVEGVKKLLPAATLITLAFTILVCSYNNGFYEVVIANYGKFNYGVSSLLAFLGCILNVDTTWIVAGIYSPIIELITDKSIFASVAMLLQGIYGIFMMVGPTSLLLILGLSYLDIPYNTYLKYIWRFVLIILLLICVIILIILKSYLLAALLLLALIAINIFVL